MNEDALCVIATYCDRYKDFLSLLLTHSEYSIFITNDNMWQQILSQLTVAQIVNGAFILQMKNPLGVQSRVTYSHFKDVCVEYCTEGSKFILRL